MELYGLVDITGSAASGSVIEVRNEAGDVIARSKAGPGRDWMIRGVEFPVGRHTIHAVATLHGVPSSSKAIAIHVEADPDDDDDDSTAVDDALSARAQRAYRNLVAAIADGQQVDQEYGLAVLEASGKSIIDMENDTARLQRIAAAERRAQEGYESLVTHIAAGGSWRDFGGAIDVLECAEKDIDELIADAEAIRFLAEDDERLSRA